MSCVCMIGRQSRFQPSFLSSRVLCYVLLRETENSSDISGLNLKRWTCKLAYLFEPFLRDRRWSTCRMDWKKIRAYPFKPGASSLRFAIPKQVILLILACFCSVSKSELFKACHSTGAIFQKGSKTI